MARKRFLELILLVAIVTAVYLVQVGCEGIEKPEPDKNKEPETEVTGAPVDSADAFYRVHLFWKGFDSDGLVQGFEYSVDDTARNADWIFTTDTDSEFVFNTATEESQVQRRYHRFFVRAIDNEGKEDPTPALIEFFAVTGAEPRSILLTDTANRLAVRGNTVFAAGGVNGLDVFDIGNPEVIERTATLFTEGVATDIVLDGDYAYLADGDRGVRVIDVAAAASPQLVAEYPTLGLAASALAFNEPYLFVADGSNGILVLDMSSPGDPAFYARYRPDPKIDFVGVAVHDDLVFGAAFEKGFLVLEFRPGEDVVLVPLPEGAPEVYALNEEALGFAPGDGILFVANGGRGLLSFAIGADGALTELGELPLQGHTLQIIKRESTIYAANGNNGVAIVDVSDPAAPALVGHVGFSGEVTGIVLSGDTLIVGNGDRGLAVVDVSEPAGASSLLDSIVAFCPESPSESETLLAYSDVKFCWSGLSPGGKVVSFRYQLQGVDLEPIVVSPDFHEAFYRTLQPKNEYYRFLVEVQDETGLWSSGSSAAERRFVVNFDPETALDSTIWVFREGWGQFPIRIADTDTLLPDSCFITFGWSHTDRDIARGDSIVGSWWFVKGAGISSAESLATNLTNEDFVGPLTSTASDVFTLEVGGIDSFGRRENAGAQFRFRVNYPPTVSILDPGEFETLITSDTITVTIQGNDIDGSTDKLIYEYSIRESDSPSAISRGEIAGLYGDDDGVLEVDVPVFHTIGQVEFAVTPTDRNGLGKIGPAASVRFTLR